MHVSPEFGLPPDETIEKVIGKRRVLLEEQAANFAGEVKGALHGTIWAHLGDAWADAVLLKISEHTDDWLMDDSIDAENFVHAAQDLVTAKQRALGSTLTRFAFARDFGVPAVTYAASAAAVKQLADDTDPDAREEAVKLLYDLEPSHIAHSYTSKLVAMLHKSHSNETIHAVVRVLSHLDPQALYDYTPTIVSHLLLANKEIKQMGHTMLGRVEPVALLASATSGNLRPATVEILRELHPQQLAAHAASVTSYLLHHNKEVRKAAMVVLGTLEDEACLEWVAPAMKAAKSAAVV